MDDFLDKLKSVRSGFFKKMRFLFILDLIIITSILYAIFIILNMQFFLEKSFSNPQIPLSIVPPVLAFVIGLMGAFLLHRKDKKKNITLLIEDKYPDLNERLRTACDNREESNIIVDSLKSYVSEMLGKVSVSQLFSKSRITAKIIVTIVFIVAVVMILITPEARVPPNDVANFMNTVGGNLGNVTNETLNPFADVSTDQSIAGRTGSGEIFGKPNIAPVEGKPVDLTLQAGGGLGNVPKDYDPSQNQFIKSAAFPVDVLGSNVSDGGYSVLMKKSETEKELINKYAIERSKI